MRSASKQRATSLGRDVLPVIGLRALRVNKQASGRPKDRYDLEQLGGTTDSTGPSRNERGGQR